MEAYFVCVNVFMHVHVVHMCVYMLMWELLIYHEGGHACVNAHMCGGQGPTLNVFLGYILRHGLPLNLGLTDSPG